MIFAALNDGFMGAALLDAGLRPRVEIYGGEEREPWMETLLWRNGDRYCLAVLKKSVDGVDALGAPRDQSKEITVRLNLRAREVGNVRTQKVFGEVSSFTDQFNTYEANLYEFAIGT